MTLARKRLRVGIDLTPLLPVPTGVDQYLVEIVRAISRMDRETLFFVLVNWEDRKRLAGGLGKNFTVVPVATRARLVRFLSQQFLLPMLAAALRFQVIHSTSFLMPFFRGKSSHVLTVFDTTMLDLPDCHNWYRRSFPFRAAVAMSIRRADLILVPSRHVQQEVLPRLPAGADEGRVRVVPLGVGDRFSPPESLNRQGLPPSLRGIPSYVLFVGTIEPRKNVETLLEGYRRAVQGSRLEEHLVLTGKHGWGRDPRRVLDKMPEVRGRVHFTGYVDPETLLALYRNAKLFIYPSKEEGFGLPPLEAMACGVPTVAADTSSLRENLRGAATLIPPGDPEALRAALVRVLGNPELRETLRREGQVRARRFTWEQAARLTLDGYRESIRIRERRWGERQPAKRAGAHNGNRLPKP
jgi:glycosyltransferase involved in cell wall biosynthesis